MSAGSAPSIDAQQSRRFPFAGHPRGWFVVAFSEDVALGQPPLRLRYFGRDLVAYRGESGRSYVTSAYCPHLGAHLGHGGTVVGETIRCPFHGWRFEGDGRCAEVPYSDRVPPKAKLEAMPVCEQNGMIHVFHDPDGGTPWPLPLLDEEDWTPARTVTWRGLATHAQEVFENTVDTAHIGPIHDGRSATLLGPPIRDGECMKVELEFQAPGDVVGMPDTINDVHLEVTLRGLGWVVVQTHVRNVDVRARQRIYATPIDEETIDIRGVVHVRKSEDEAFTNELAEIFYKAYVEDFAKDFPIWENKRYVARPMLAKGDGPIAVYRMWCEQFYRRADTTRAPTADAPSAETPDVPASALRARREGAAPIRDRVAAWIGAVGARMRSGAPAARDEASEGDASVNEVAVATARVGGGNAAAARSVAAPAPSTRRVSSVQEYFDTLGERFVPAASNGYEAVFQWELDGVDGATFHAHVRDGRVEIARGAHAKPTVALVMGADDYVRVVNGEIDGTWAFTSGRGKVRGSLGAAMKMRSIFPA